MNRQSATTRSRHQPDKQLGVQGGISTESSHPPCFAKERPIGKEGTSR